MTLANWPLLVLGLLVVAGGAWWWRRRDPVARLAPGDLHAANTDRLRESPRYRRLARAALRRSLVAVVSAALVASGSLLLVGRLADATAGPNSQHSRDVMLCLDVSGSMREVDATMLRAYAKLVERLRGERVGLTIWNSSAVMVFPLTDDYGFIAAQIERAAVALDSNDFDFVAGTSSARGGSLIGDGLASCVQRFDRLEEPRSRSVVLATDNELSGKPIFTLPQAIDLAISRQVAVHAIAERDDREIAELRDQVRRTRGEMFLVGSGDGANVVAAIEATEARRLEGPAGARVADVPLPGLLLCALGLVGLALPTLGALRRPGGRARR